MCSNFTPTKSASWVHASFGVELPQPLTSTPDDRVFPQGYAPFLVKSRKSGQTAIGHAQFGLIPPWAKDNKIARHTYNARSETVADKPSFRNAWKKLQFGLVLVDSFNEPSYQSGKAVSTPIGLTSGDPFAIACLWDRWTDPATGELVVSFSMLTVNADEHPVMKKFHKPGDEKRTPVIIRSDLHDAWLGADTAQAQELMSWKHMPDVIALSVPRD